MLIPVTLMPIMFGMLTDVPAAAPPSAAPLSVVVTLVVTVGVTLRATGVVRLWAPVIGIAARLRDRRLVRHLRHATRRRGGLDRPPGRRVAGPGPALRGRLLGAAAGVRVRDPDRRHRDHRRQRRHPAGLAADAARHRLPRRAGGGHGGRRRQPALGPRGDGAQHDLFVQRLGDGHHRGRLPHRRRLHRGHLPRAGVPAEVHGADPRHSRPGRRRLHHRADGHAVRARHARRGRGRRGLPEGASWRASASGSASVSRTS